MRIAIASGKGGTGKTTVSVHLAWALAQHHPVQYVDCDVEEPNGHLFLKPEIETQTPVSMPVPQVNPDLCTHCGECSAICAFGAIVATPSLTLTFPELCHGCGGCSQVCPTGAISEVDRTTGVVETGYALAGEPGTGQVAISFLQGRLHVGEAMSPPVIRALKSHIDPDALAILDLPPGTSCPATTALRGVDRALLVAEPTPFGLHDLTLAVEMVRTLGIPFAVVVNRAGLGDNRVEEFCAREGIPIWARLPHDRRVAEAYARGQLRAVPAEIQETLAELAQRLLTEVRP